MAISHMRKSSPARLVGLYHVISWTLPGYMQFWGLMLHYIHWWYGTTIPHRWSRLLVDGTGTMARRMVYRRPRSEQMKRASHTLGTGH